MKYGLHNRVRKIERIISPKQEKPIIITINTRHKIDFDQIRLEYNKNNLTNYSSEEWQKMDVIVKRNYFEGEVEYWIIDTVTMTGETEEEIYKKYPSLYKKFKYECSKIEVNVNELINQITKN